MATGSGGIDWVGWGERLAEAQELPALSNYRRKKWGRSQEFAGWLSETELPCLSTEQALLLYRASGSNRRAEFSRNSIEDLRDSLDFLLYDTIKLEGRFQECAADDGAYRLAGAGKEFVSYCLCVKDPGLFAVWNTNSQRAMKRVGLNGREKGRAGSPATGKIPLGIVYMDVLETSAVIRHRLGLPDFQALDEFSYLVTHPAISRHETEG